MSVADKITQLNGIKNDIKQAIIDKGVEVTSETPFTDYANKIGEISGGGGKIDVAATGAKYAYSNSIPDNADFSKCTNFGYMFANSFSIPNFSMVDSKNVNDMHYCFYNAECNGYPSFNTANVTDMSYCFGAYSSTLLSAFRSLNGLSSWDVSKVKNFSGCFYNRGYLNDDWMDDIKNWDVSSAEDMSSMFYYGNRLSGTGYGHKTDYSDLNSWDTRKVKSFANCFYYNSSMTVAPSWNTSSATNLYYLFYNCQALTTVPAYDGSSIINTTNAQLFGGNTANQPKNVTSFGGLVGTKYGYYVNNMTKLTVESLMNIINGLYDFSDGTPHTTADTTMTLGATNLAKLTPEQIAVATAKGWTLK